MSARLSGASQAGSVYNLSLWKAVNVPAGSAGAGMGRDGLGTSDNYYVAPHAGRIVGISAEMSGNVTAGQATFQVGVNDVYTTAAASVLTVSSVAPARFKATPATFTPIPFAAGDRISVRVVTDAGYLPVTLDPVVDLKVATP